MGWIIKEKKPSEYHFMIDGVSSFKYGIRVATVAKIDTPKPKYHDFDDVLGRNGTTSSFMGTYDNKTMEFSCSFVNDNKLKESWYNQYRKIKNWIMSANDNSMVHRLQQSDDAEWYMNIEKADISECERTGHIVGSFTITFTLDPFDWSIGGEKWRTIDDIRYNPYIECYPLWRIVNHTGVNNDFAISVNGNDPITVLNCESDREYYIDTELLLTYSKYPYQEGIYRAGRSGLEEKARLAPGRNVIDVTPGFVVTCKPRWRSL